MNTLEEKLNLLIEAYYGLLEMDEYDLKEYELKKLKDEIDSFINEYNINNFDFESVKNNISLRTKLQSLLIVLNKNNGPLELILLVKRRLKDE
jgi:hypothetical protein